LIPARTTTLASRDALHFSALTDRFIQNRAGDRHHRVRTDRIDADGKLTLRHCGRLHHIGIGRDRTGT
jgi:hypothetical protein